MKNTPIQWCDDTANPTMGCEGCELWTKNVKKCYAGVLHRRHGGKNKGYSPTFEKVTLFPGRMAKAARRRDLTGKARLDKPWLDGLPRTVFVSDMSDALSSVVPFDFLEKEVIDNVSSVKGQRHHWLWLTKRPDRMAKFSAWLAAKGILWPANLWAGTSITTQSKTRRIDHLLKVGDERTIRFLSVEPQYEPVDLTKWLPRLNWVIQGGESGPKAVPFDIAWAHDLIEQCRRFKVHYFLKQLGSVVVRNGQRVRFNHNHGGDWSEWPKEIRVRQMPISVDVKPRRNKSHAVRVSREPSKQVCLMGSPNDKKQTRSEAALKAWRTRRENDLRKKPGEPGRKARRTHKGPATGN